MDAPDFELSTPATDSSDALQLDPADSLAAFEIAPVASKPALKPKKKPTEQHNDAVIAALLGKPLTAKVEAAPDEVVGPIERPVVEKVISKPPEISKPARPDSILGALLGKEVAVTTSAPAPLVEKSDVGATHASPVDRQLTPPGEACLAPTKIESVSDPEIIASDITAFKETFVIPEPQIEMPTLRLTYSEADFPPLDIDAEMEAEALDLPPKTLRLPQIITQFRPQPAANVADPIDDDPIDTPLIDEAPAIEPTEDLVIAEETIEAMEPVKVEPVIAPAPIDIAAHLQSAFAMNVDAEPEADDASAAAVAMAISPELPRGKTGAWWTLPLMFAGIAIVACAVLVPATDENRRAMYELAKIDRDVTYFQKQSDVNKDFLQRVSNDPTLAERLALRQLHMTLADTHLVKLPSKAEPFNRSPFALVSVEPPPLLAPYRTVAGLLGEWFLDIRRQIYLAGIGLMMAAAGVILGGGEPKTLNSER